MCRSRLWLLYWVSTQIFLMPALTRFDSAKSTSRYRPPNGTADFALSSVRRAACPPRPRGRCPGPAGSPTCPPLGGTQVRLSQAGRSAPAAIPAAARADGRRNRGRTPGSGPPPASRPAWSTVSSRSRSAWLISIPSRSSEPGAGSSPIGVSTASASPDSPLDDPLEHPELSPKPGQMNLPSSSLRNQFTWKMRGSLAASGACAELQPVPEVVGHVVAAERQHRERVAPQLARPCPRPRRCFSEATLAPRNTPCSQSNASITSGTVGGAAAAEQDRRDRHPGRVFPLGRDHRALVAPAR